MEIKIEHPILSNRMLSEDEVRLLFKGVRRFSDYNNKIKMFSSSEIGSNYGGGIYENPARMLEGHLLELLCEILYKLRPFDEDLGGVNDYHPNLLVDKGVDGHGKNLDSKTVVISCKYKSDPRELITTKNTPNIGHIFIQGPLTFGIDSLVSPSPKNPRFILFTTSVGLNPKLSSNEGFFEGHFFEVGIDKIRKKCSDLEFWEKANQLIQKSICLYYGKKISTEFI